MELKATKNKLYEIVFIGIQTTTCIINYQYIIRLLVLYLRSVPSMQKSVTTFILSLPVGPDG